MPTKTKLTKTVARKNSIKEVCIDAENQVYVTIKTPSPTVLMEMESAMKDNSFPVIVRLVKENLIEPKIVEQPSDNEGEMTLDELGGYFIPIANAIMDSVDPSGETRKKAESFLADGTGAHGRGGSNGVLHAAQLPPAP